MKRNFKIVHFLTHVAKNKNRCFFLCLVKLVLSGVFIFAKLEHVVKLQRLDLNLAETLHT